MTVVKISELPQKDALEDGDKVIAWNSANGATSVLLGTAFTAIKEASATSASAAKASETAAKNLASEASSSADSASKSASGAALSAEAAKASETNALASANSASASQTQIESDIAQAKLDITTERTAAVSAVEAAQAAAISSIQTQGTESVTAVTAAQATSVSAVKAQETASIQAIEADSVLAGYAKKDELISTLSEIAEQISSKQDASTAVTLDGAQTITGAKTFSSTVTVTGDVVSSGVIKGTQFTAVNGGNKNIDFFAYGYPIVTSTLAGGWSLVDGTFPSGGWAQILTNYGDQSCTGTMRAAAFVQTSDARKKAGLTPIHPDLSSLTAYRYTLEADGKTHVGLVAQEVEKVIPEAVVEDKEGFLALDYSAVVTALVDEVNRLRKRVEALEGVGEN